MTDQDKNRIVHEWRGLCWHEKTAGLTPQCKKCLIFCNFHPNPDYYNSPNNEAFSLLDVLVERGYCYRLKDIGVGSMFEIWRRDDFIGIADSVNKSKSQAIVNAILMLLRGRLM